MNERDFFSALEGSVDDVSEASASALRRCPEPCPPELFSSRLRALRAGLAGSRRRGMTLIEIMIVVAIMAAIMSVVGFHVFGFATEANSDLARTQLGQIKGALDMYRVSENRMPASLDALVDRNMMESVPQDPWGNDYEYQPSGMSAKVFSVGPDGSPNTEDDIVVELHEGVAR